MATEAVPQSDRMLQNRHLPPLGRDYRPRSCDISLCQMSPAVAKKIQTFRYKKQGSFNVGDVWNEKTRSKSADCLETTSDSSEDGGGEESPHPSDSQPRRPQEDGPGGAGSPGISPEGPMVYHGCGSLPSWQGSPLSKQSPPPAEATENPPTAEGHKSKPLPGEMESFVPSLERLTKGEYDASSKIDSVLLSIQKVIDQVERGVLTTDVFFFTVKDLLEDYMYVDFNMANPFQQYDKLPKKRQLSFSHDYLDIIPRPFIPPQPEHNTRAIPRAKTVHSVAPFAKEDSPVIKRRMTDPVVSTLTRSLSVPSLFTGDVQLKKHLTRSASSQISLDQDGYTLVRNPGLRCSPGGLSSTFPIRHTPPALPPRSFKARPAMSERPLPLPPHSPRELPDGGTRQSLPPRIPRRPPHTMINRQCPPIQSSFTFPSLLEYDDQTKLPGSVPPKLSADSQISLNFTPRSAAHASVPFSFPPMHKHDCEDHHIHQQLLYEVSDEHDSSARSQSDSPQCQVFPFSPPVSDHGSHLPYTPDNVMKEGNHNNYGTEGDRSDDESDVMVSISEVVRQYRGSQMRRDLKLLTPSGLVRSASLDDVATPCSSDYDVATSRQLSPLPSSAHSTNQLSTPWGLERCSKLYSTSLSNLAEPMSPKAEEENTYSIPPDAVVGYVEPLFSQPMQSYFQFLQMANVNHSAQSIHMEGTLTVRPRRGAKRERYFILRKMELQMHSLRVNTKNAAKSLLKTYRLDQWCQMKVGKVHNVFVLVTDEEELELAAASSLEYCQWVEKISQALKSTQKPMARHQQNKTAVQGPLHVVINGLTFKCCGAISDQHLKLYRSSEDDEPFYALPLQGVSMSKEDEVSLPGCQQLYPKPICDISDTVPRIHLHGNGSSLYLLFKGVQEYSEWHYYLCLDSDTECSRCTPLEKAIWKLRNGKTENDVSDGESPTCDECKDIPLTILPSLEWEEAAVEMFKHIKVFVSTPLMPSDKSQSWQKGGMSYFATFIQNIIDKCLKTRQLRNEFYCQLISLIAKHSGENSMEALQSWLLLAITIPFFLPLKSKFLWYLEQHINKYRYSRLPQVVAFAECCQRRLARAVENKERNCRPPFCELLHQLSQFPEPPNDPFVVEVMLSTGERQSIKFDSSSTVQEVVSQINQELGLPSSHETGFSLACDWPGLEDAQISLHPLEKVADVVSSWNDSLSLICGHSCSSRHIQLVYCSRVYFQARAGHEDSKEALLLIHQVNQEVVNSRIEVDLETAKELSSLMLHVEYGSIRQHTSPLELVKEALWKFFPMKETRRILDLDRRQNVDAILSLWSRLQNTSKEECIRLYLQRVRRIPAFGFRHFQVTRLSLSGSSRATIAVGEDGIQIKISSSSQQSLREIPYHMVESFGSSGTDFMLYINDRAMGIREKMIFGMPQVLVQELTLLIASYMEVFLKTSMAQPASRTPSLATLV